MKNTSKSDSYKERNVYDIISEFDGLYSYGEIHGKLLDLGWENVDDDRLDNFIKYIQEANASGGGIKNYFKLEKSFLKPDGLDEIKNIFLELEKLYKDKVEKILKFNNHIIKKYEEEYLSKLSYPFSDKEFDGYRKILDFLKRLENLAFGNQIDILQSFLKENKNNEDEDELNFLVLAEIYVQLEKEKDIKYNDHTSYGIIDLLIKNDIKKDYKNELLNGLKEVEKKFEIGFLK